MYSLAGMKQVNRYYIPAIKKERLSGGCADLDFPPFSEWGLATAKSLQINYFRTTAHCQSNIAVTNLSY